MKQPRLSTAQDLITKSAVEQSATNLVAKGSVLLVTRSGILAHSLPVAVNLVPVALNQDIKAVTPYASTDAEYLRLIFQGFERNILNTCRKGGTTVHSIEFPALQEFAIPLPPLNEQKRIVAKIEELSSELEAGEESLRKARRQLGVYRQSLLKQAFEGKLTAKWRTQNPSKLESPAQLLARIQSARQSRYEEQLKNWEAKAKKWETSAKEERKPTKPSLPVPASELKSTEEMPLHDLPNSWIWLRFDSAYAQSVLGKMLDAEKNQGQPRPYLRNINVRWGRFDLEDLLTIKIEETEIDRYRVSPGDLVICEGGEPGRCAVWSENQEEVVFLQKALHRVRFPAVISPFYIEHLMSFLAGTKLLEKHFTGTTIKHLTGEGLAGVPAPICSLPEQQEIVRLLDEQFEVIARNEQEIDTALKRSEALRQAILKKAFTGHLVPQDPADKPASALLTRIREPRQIFEPRDYFAQLIPALLRVYKGSESLERLNAAVALLFKPKILMPMAESAGAEHAAHFKHFKQPLKEAAFADILRLLVQNRVVLCEPLRDGVKLRLIESEAPPIDPVVSEDARHLGAFLPAGPIVEARVITQKLCPPSLPKELLTMA